MNLSQFCLMALAGTLAAGLGMALSRWLRRRRKDRSAIQTDSQDSPDEFKQPS
jgi:hypothetical protein